MIRDNSIKDDVTEAEWLEMALGFTAESVAEFETGNFPQALLYAKCADLVAPHSPLMSKCLALQKITPGCLEQILLRVFAGDLTRTKKDVPVNLVHYKPAIRAILETFGVEPLDVQRIFWLVEGLQDLGLIYQTESDFEWRDHTQNHLILRVSDRGQNWLKKRGK